MSIKLAVTGIGTGVGKTVVSSMLAQALEGSYWKPIQAGDLENSDSITVQSLTSDIAILPERFRLKTPMSPHEAARIDGIEIGLSDLHLPEVEGNLIVEGAGGLMVPINYKGETYLDLFKQWELPVVVVSRNYLGSINHTLLTINALKSAGISIYGIVFNGERNESTEKIILESTKVDCLGRIPEAHVDKSFIEEQCKQFRL